METTLTTYLFRTICFKPKGLRVRLRVTTVSRTVVTFDEKQFPAATIMSHGLFLAQPTPVGVKDPMLFAVLNQGTLNDDPHKAQFVVYSREEPQSDAEGPLSLDEGSMMENPLGKRAPPSDACRRPDSDKCTQLRLTLMRNGMVKELPNPVLLKHQSEIDHGHSGSQGLRSAIYPLEVYDRPHSACIDYRTGSENSKLPSTPYPIPPSEIFAASIRFIVEKYCFLDLNANADTAPSLESQPEEFGREAQFARFDDDFIRIIYSLDSMFESLLLSMEHWSSFLPSQIAEDYETQDAGREETHRQLRALASACLELLLRPVFQTIEGIQPVEISEELLEQRDKTKDYILEYIQFFVQIERSTRKELLETLRLFHERRRLSNISLWFTKLWKSIPVKKGIRSQIMNGLSMFHSPKQIDTKQNSLHLLEDLVANRFARIADNLLAEQSIHPTCLRLSAKGTPRVNFGPTFDGTHALKIRAIIQCHQNTICILAVDAAKPKSNSQEISRHHQIKIKSWIKLFRNAAEIASFDLEFNIDNNLLSSDGETTHHFTGRYLIHIGWGDSLRAQQLCCLDLAPCLQHQPESPVVLVQSVKQWIGSDLIDFGSIAFTGDFLAYLRVTLTQPQSSSVESADICVQVYKDMKENAGPLRISVKEAFQQIINVIGMRSPKYRSTRLEALRFTRKPTVAYFAQWDYQGYANKQNTLLVACFEVNIHLRVAKLIAYSFSHLEAVQTEQFYPNYPPRFHTLHTQVRDYLVMDLCLPQLSAPYSKPVAADFLVRILFTVHKNQIHRVAVNRQPVWKFPSNIGPRLKYAGYHTQHVPDFHHRRVFSSDKVVSAVYRLDYKLL